MIIERNELFTSIQGLYTKDNKFMVERNRPNLESVCNGVKVFNGRGTYQAAELNQYGAITAETLRYSPDSQMSVWRAEEVIEASELLREHGRVIIEGASQSGKGTIVFGLSTMCDLENRGYLLIDGHRQETDVSPLVEAISEANKDGKVIFFDSADYMFLGTRKVRKISQSAQSHRTSQLVNALADCQVPLVMTSHGGYWEQLFINFDEKLKYSNFLETFATYELSRLVTSDESQRIFAVHHGLNAEEADIFIDFPESEAVLQVITETFGDDRVREEVSRAARDYAVLKIMLRDTEADSSVSQVEHLRQILQLVKSGSREATLTLIEELRNAQATADFHATLRYTKEPSAKVQ